MAADEEEWEDWSSDDEAGGGDGLKAQDTIGQLEGCDGVRRPPMQVSERFLQEVFDLVKVRDATGRGFWVDRSDAGRRHTSEDLEEDEHACVRSGLVPNDCPVTPSYAAILPPNPSLLPTSLSGLSAEAVSS